jgi:asparagine synthase (glutamine-hydrolysing)
MCGIAGIVGRPPATTMPRVRAALRRLAHRGPDGEGLFERPGVAMGMRRLAIIDLEHGDQPICNEDGSIAVVCNGELYNYVEGFGELRSRGHRLQSESDVNLIPHYYEELGERAFERLRGMFAAALWDDARQRLVLARDPVGKKPLFYARIEGALAFASELPALLALLDRVPELDADAIADYLQLGFIPHPHSVYHGVAALPPGSTLVFTHRGELQIRSFWAPTHRPQYAGSRLEALEAVEEGVRDAVRLRLRSDVPIGLFLSGGIDSGLVAAYAAQAGARDLLCFVIEVDDPRLNEAPAALKTAERLGLPVERVPLRVAPLEAVERVPALYGQPFGDSSAVPSYFVAQAASRHRKVVLNGDGGDEVFAGYRRYWTARLSQRLLATARWGRPALGAAGRALARRANRRSAWGFAARTLRGLAAPPGDRCLIWSVDLLDDATLTRCFPALARRGGVAAHLRELRGPAFGCDQLKTSQQSDYRLILADDLVVKMDIATMANSLEARSPLLDVPLTELVWSLPDHWLIRLRETKPLLRALARRLLPVEVAKAPKRGFEVPVAAWLAGGLRPLVEDTLLSDSSRVCELGDGHAIRAFVRGESAFAGNRPQAVWCLLMLELFLRAPTPGACAA